MDVKLFVHILFLNIGLANGQTIQKQEYAWIEEGKSFEGLSKEWTSDSSATCTSSTAMIARCSARYDVASWYSIFCIEGNVL